MILSRKNHLSPFSGLKILTTLFIFLTIYVILNGNWKRTRYPIQMDANGYYIFLPAIFIYHDLKNLAFVNSMPEQFDRKYFLYPNIHGGYLSKYAPGTALLQLPFFFAAHLLAPAFHQPSDGYSPPYRLAVALSTIFYSWLSFLFLRKLLLRYFQDRTSTIALIFLALGTNAFFYGILQAGLVHNYLLCVFSLMLLCLDTWQKSSGWKYFAAACACVGFMTCIRPTEALTGLVPIAYFLHRWKQNLFRLEHFTKQFPAIAGGVFAFILGISPVLLYWKFATGQWIAYTYEQEGFYFDRPWQIWYGLFGFRKGWFIYTPMAGLALFGLLQIRKDPRFASAIAALAAYLPLNMFLVLSWYCWWYGGCFGQRAFIPVMALLCLPLAALLESILKQAKFLLLIPMMLTILNLFQSFQYQRQILHMDAMTWEAYVYVFGKWKLSDNEKKEVKGLLDPPDYSERGKKLNEYFR